MTFHFREFLKRGVAYVRQWFLMKKREAVQIAGPAPNVTPSPPKAPPVAPSPPKAPRPKVDIDGIERNGSFYLRGAILDELDRYMTYIRRMKRADPEAYALYSKVGAHITPSQTLMSLDLNCWWKDKSNRPSFGAISMCKEEEGKALVNVRFAYFQKLEKAGVDVQKSDGDVYRVTCYLDDKVILKKRKHGVPVSFYIDIDLHGNVRLLKTFGPVVHPIGKSDFVRMEWCYPKYPRGGSKRAAEIFSLFADAFYLSNLSGFQVRASKNGDTAVFAIAENRATYFFRDRDDTQGKKKIFHAVRAHKRDVDGKTVNVRTHYRGLRSFNWQGYDITISVPGLHHAAPTDARFSGLEFDAFDENVGDFMDIPQVGEYLGSHFSGDQSKQRRVA